LIETALAELDFLIAEAPRPWARQLELLHTIQGVGEGGPGAPRRDRRATRLPVCRGPLPRRVPVDVGVTDARLPRRSAPLAASGRVLTSRKTTGIPIPWSTPRRPPGRQQSR
jgi:hypothetical protein